MQDSAGERMQCRTEQESACSAGQCRRAQSVQISVGERRTVQESEGSAVHGLSKKRVRFEFVYWFKATVQLASTERVLGMNCF